MAKKINFKDLKFFSSDWVITLSATLIGVFLALYLNEWVSSMKLDDQKELATINVLAEISSNQEKLEKSIISQGNLLKCVEFLSIYSNEEDDLIAPIDSMNKLKNAFPELIIIKDSTLLGNNLCKYKGEFNFEVALSNIEITSIAWETLKNSGIATYFDFNCLLYLETVDKVSHEVKQNNQVLLDYLSGKKDSGDKNEALLRHLSLLIDYQKSLIGIYKDREDALSDCI